MTIFLPTTEDMVWIWLPFKIRKADVGLTAREAKRRAILYRRADRLARVLRPVGSEGWQVATYKPRRIAPRQCDLRI